MDKALFIYHKSETIVNCNDPKTQMNLICKEFCSKAHISINLVKFIYNRVKLNQKLRFEQLNNSPFDKYKVIFVFDIKEQSKKEFKLSSKILYCPICHKFIDIIISNFTYKYKCINAHDFESYFLDIKLIRCMNCSNNIKTDIYSCELCNNYICSKCDTSKHKLLDNINNYRSQPLEDDINPMNTHLDIFSSFGAINIIYFNNKQSPIKIFGSYFVNKNKGKCKILYMGEYFDLSEYFCKLVPYDFLNIQLVGIINITDMSCMFEETSLIGIYDFLNWNSLNITDLSYMFCGCSLLESLPDISHWNTTNVTNLSYMFSGCKSLKALSDNSKWDTQNVINMSHLFGYCSSLIALPDISKWNTKKVTNISGIFTGCSSLSTLPDISKWNTDNITNISGMFSHCSSLAYLPDLSKWNMKKVTNKSYVFNKNKKYSNPLRKVYLI